jgi:hypothetical protein
MPRDLPPAALAAMMAQETADAFLTLLTITLDNPPDLHFTDNSVDITSTVADGSTPVVYTAIPFTFIAPANKEGELAQARLTIDNVGRELVDDIRQQVTPLKVSITVVSSADLNTQVALFSDMTLRNVNYNSLSISGVLVLENLYAENFSQLLTGRYYPALFF